LIRLQWGSELMSDGVVVLGGTGFVGRFLAERWPYDHGPPPRFLIHRSCPEWLTRQGRDVRHVDLSDTTSVAEAVDGATTLINLLRPDGTAWLERVVEALIPVITKTSISRLLHTSSIDVYGATPERLVTTDTIPKPITPYECEHARIEQLVSRAALQTSIVRPGAIFGIGGRNLVSFVPEIRDGPQWKLVARRALYGRRRLHLVSVENVADVLCLLARPGSKLPARLIACDDVHEENHFEFVQATMMRHFGRAPIRFAPRLPPLALRAVLRAKGRNDGRPIRRYSNGGLHEIGFLPEKSFANRLNDYASFLADTEENGR
jgi:nucleoside-diphosphate-sugar epimerase